MSSEKESYKQIFKTTSIFGGIQVFNILISIAKSKIIAVLLGPAGLGIISIFTSTSTLIASFTNLGINIAAVKSIATLNQYEDQERQQTIIGVVKKLVWYTGLLGFLVAVVLSPLLSKISFGNYSYTFSFALLGLSLLALQVSQGQATILQGLRKIKLIALSSLIGAVFGFVVSVPLYYVFGTDGIVPAIVATSIAAVLTSWYFLRKAEIPSLKVDFITVKKEGIGIIKLGFLISITFIFPALVAYVGRLFIANIGNIADVGLYTAGFAIVGTYVGMVFSAMSIDYYPSLSEVANDQLKFSKKINQQILVSILILAPILTVLIVFIKLGIIILYSAKFLGTVRMIQWAALGVFFQAFSWCIAFIFLAKGDSKVYLWNELIPSMYMLILNCICYYFWGLEGMGLSFLIGYFLYAVQVYIVAKKKYDFRFEAEVLKICFIHLALLITVFLVVYNFSTTIQYTVGLFIIVISIVYSVKIMEKKIGFYTPLLNKIKGIR